MTQMTPDPMAAPWHRESYERFLAEGLPGLLAPRLPLDAYGVEPAGDGLRLSLTVGGDAGPLTLAFGGIPACADAGWFLVPALADTPEGPRRVVLPRADSEDLEAARVVCVGEQLAAAFEEQLSHLPDDLLRLLEVSDGRGDDPAARLRTWLPLDEWFRDFFARAQMADPSNTLATHTYLRRLLVDVAAPVGWHPSQVGRVCLLEVPEGPNMGRIYTVARGAVIREGRLVVVDARPEQAFGISAGLIPFAHHSEPARTLMGANMMRQWHRLPAAERPLVTTGMAPEEREDMWCGLNLLTAYVFWGVETHEDALVVSESAAAKLGYPYPLEPGDKLSNRHGTKGVIGRILPDDEMPHLPDGTPAEISYTFFGLPSRMNHGQLLEAALGLAAKADGKPAVAPPFGGPSADELRARLSAARLPPSGMMRLTEGRGGAPLERESAVGYVYWGRTHHDVRDKVKAIPAGGTSALGQRIGPDEYRLLRDAGAWETLYSLTVVQNAERPDAAGFAERVASRGELAGAGEGAGFRALTERLAALGVRAEVAGDAVRFAFGEREEPAVALPEALPHPWARERTLERLGPDPQGIPEWAAARDAAERLRRTSASGAPATLRASGADALRQRVNALADALLDPAAFAPVSRSLFSARSVLAPGTMAWDEIGLPDEIAWPLFGPLAVRDGLATAEAVAARTPEAARALEERMSCTWVLVNRQPSLYSTSIIAFRARRVTGYAIRINPLVLPWLEADYDGDQLAVFLPLTEGAQREAEELLSVRGHLRRDPSLLARPYAGLIAGHGLLYGLAERSRTPEGRQEIESIVGRPVPVPAGYLERGWLVEALTAVLRDEGIDAALERVTRLAEYGFAAAKRSGASLGPFLGGAPTLPPPPAETADADEWDAWGEQCVERLSAAARAGDFPSNEFGPALLAAVSGARGRVLFLAKALASVSPGAQPDAYGKPIPTRHGWRDGVTPDEFAAVVANTRKALMGTLRERVWLPEEPGTAPPRSDEAAPRGSGVIARALRSRRPGVVFAQAALSGETDALTDPDTRLLVGLPPTP